MTRQDFSRWFIAAAAAVVLTAFAAAVPVAAGERGDTAGATRQADAHRLRLLIRIAKAHNKERAATYYSELARRSIWRPVRLSPSR